MNEQQIFYEFRSVKSFKERRRESLIFDLTIIGIVVLAVSFITSPINAIGVGIIFFAFQYFKSERSIRYFITDIRMNKQTITINFTRREIRKKIEGPVSDFNIKKKFALNRTRTAYLAVYYKKTLVIKQFEQADWNESEFNRVLSAFESFSAPVN